MRKKIATYWVHCANLDEGDGTLPLARRPLNDLGRLRAEWRRDSLRLANYTGVLCANTTGARQTAEILTHRPATIVKELHPDPTVDGSDELTPMMQEEIERRSANISLSMALSHEGLATIRPLFTKFVSGALQAVCNNILQIADNDQSGPVLIVAHMPYLAAIGHTACGAIKNHRLLGTHFKPAGAFVIDFLIPEDEEKEDFDVQFAFALNEI